MTAAEVMDGIARLPDCEGQAADAGSAYTQVKLEDAPRLLKNFKKSNVQIMDTSSTTHMTEIMLTH